jgi:ceramide glucosyltransferase
MFVRHSDSMDASEGLLLTATAASAGLYVVMASGFLAAMARRGKPSADPPQVSRPQSRPPAERPRVSILKPLAGIDDELEANLASFGELDYPEYEVLVGVASTEDPAYAIARRFVEKLGKPRARLLVTDPEEATNPKVAQLLSLERAATGAIVVISDSNVRVTPGYLDPLVAELSRPEVAVVSSVVAGTGEQTFGAALENLQLGALVAPGVVSSHFLTGRTITVGKSMAMRRDLLRSIGGFARVKSLLSEDHMLGRAFAEAGFKVSVSLQPVENRNVACSLRRTIERHTRWAKMRRSLAPLGFLLEPCLYPVVMATLACLILPTKTLCLAFLACVFLQTAGALVTTRVLRGNTPRWYWIPLEIIRSYLLFFCWLRACLSRRVSWRGHDFELARHSEIVPAEPSVWSRVRTMVRA